MFSGFMERRTGRAEGAWTDEAVRRSAALQWRCEGTEVEFDGRAGPIGVFTVFASVLKLPGVGTAEFAGISGPVG
jgi:hypothetical protein